MRKLTSKSFTFYNAKFGLGASIYLSTRLVLDRRRALFIIDSQKKHPQKQAPRRSEAWKENGSAPGY